MAQLDYDESGQFFPFFLVTLLLLVLVPTTYVHVRAYTRLRSAASVFGDCSHDQHAAETPRFRRPWTAFVSRTRVALAAGWILTVYLAIRIVAQAGVRGGTKVYDPYEILGIHTSATAEQIRKHYKKLSVKFHPDKVKLDANKTLEEVGAYFVELTKAYKALTDEEVRRNYEEFGHPDGKQDFGMGIALPQWIVDSQNNYYVLGVYGLVFGFILPFSVGTWWYGSRTQTKDGVHVNTASRLFRTYRKDATRDERIDTLAHAEEFSRLERDRRRSARKASELLHAQIYREPVAEKEDAYNLYFILTAAPRLLRAMVVVDGAFEHVAPCLQTLELSQSLSQALPPGTNPLKQLPFVTRPGRVHGRNVDSITDLLALPMPEQRIALGGLAEADFKRAMHVARHIPVPEVTAHEFTVNGEPIVTPESIVTFKLWLRIQGSAEKDRKTGDTDKSESGSAAGSDSTAVQMPYAYAPHYPIPLKPKWWILMCVQRTGRLLVPPVPVSDFGSQPRSFELQLRAPDHVDSIELTIHIVSDVYLGSSTTFTSKLVVSDASAIVDDVREDEISDPEEDSFAGQMQQLRGGAVKRTDANNEESEIDSESEDESDSDFNSSDDDDFKNEKSGTDLPDYNTDSD